MRKGIGGAQLVARREKKEGSAGAVRNAKLAQRVHHRLHTVLVGGHGEDARNELSKCFSCCFPACAVRCAHFPLEARLQKIGAADRHRAPVDLDHKGMARAIRELESEDEVGDETDLVHGLVRVHAQR